jgi:fatty-acyl-CoA synthase
MTALRTLPEALADAARTDKGLVFIADGIETRRSFADLRLESLGVARALREAGLRPGDLAALVIDDAAQFLTTLCGASLAGIIPASLYPPVAASNPSAYREATARIIRLARARAVITTNALRQQLDDMRASCPSIDVVLSRETLDAPPLEPDHTVLLDDIALVQFTSGSTAVPKGVVLTHRSLSANIDAINGPAGLGSSATDSALSWLPLYHDMGLIGMTLGPLYCGRPAVLLTPQAFARRPVEWLRAISRHRATISFAPNFAYALCVRRVKDRDLDGLDLSCWRVAGCGGEPIHAPTLTAFAEKFAPVGFRETSFLPSYGLAEHVLAATFAPHGRRPRVEKMPTDDLTEWRPAAPDNGTVGSAAMLVSCGRPFPGHRLRIVDRHDRELPERHVGEIALAGPSVMQSYYEQDELTAATLRNGWLYTGDLGYVSDGELFVCGRVKDIIIVNGRKYHPQDLEWGVEDLAGIRHGRIVAFGAPRHGGPDRVVIVAEPSGTETSDILIDSIRRRIGDLCGLPVDDVVLVRNGTVARTTSGKVQRAAIKARYERGELVAGGGDQGGLRA